MKKSLAVLTIICAIAILPGKSRADDLGPIFTTPLAGIPIGALAGYLATFLTSDPSDHYNSYVSIGAGVGFACGLALGISSTVNPTAGFYQINSGKEKLYGLHIRVPLQ